MFRVKERVKLSSEVGKRVGTGWSGKGNLDGEVPWLGKMCCRTAWATSDGFNTIGRLGNDMVRLLRSGLRLGNWTEGIGVISCRDCKCLKVLRNKFRASCSVGLDTIFDFMGGNKW